MSVFVPSHPFMYFIAVGLALTTLAFLMRAS